jgi:hypothetical protein
LTLSTIPISWSRISKGQQRNHLKTTGIDCTASLGLFRSRACVSAGLQVRVKRLRIGEGAAPSPYHCLAPPSSTKQERRRMRRMPARVLPSDPPTISYLHFLPPFLLHAQTVSLAVSLLPPSQISLYRSLHQISKFLRRSSQAFSSPSHTDSLPCT